MIHAGSVLITGANRGIGLGLVREYLSNDWLVHACCRTPSESVDLRSLVETHPSRLRIRQVDVTDPGQIERLSQDLCGIPLDLLINNAAVYGQRGATLFNVDVEVWRTVHATNVVGPALMTRALLLNQGSSPRLSTQYPRSWAHEPFASTLLIPPATWLYGFERGGVDGSPTPRPGRVQVEAIRETCDRDRLVIPDAGTSFSIRRVQTPSRYLVATTVVRAAPLSSFHQPVREVRARTQIGARHVDRAGAGVEVTVTVPVAGVGPLRAPYGRRRPRRPRRTSTC